MGNNVNIKIYAEDKYAVMIKSDFAKLLKLAKSNDGYLDYEIKQIPKNTNHILFNWFEVEGSHGAFKNIFDDRFLHSIKPVKGKIRVIYHDTEAPQILRRTIKNR